MREDFVLHTPGEIEKIRRAAGMAAEAREQICSLVRSGMTTWDLDELAGEVIRAKGGIPTFLNYRGYPGNICISINVLQFPDIFQAVQRVPGKPAD